MSGQWFFDKENFGVNRAPGWGILDERGTIGVTVHTKRLSLIGEDEIIEHAEANARLIAAAPEMLDAMEGFVHLYDAGVEFDEARLRKTALVFRAAIAKAKGE